jgi:electron transfer flavoprotein beta subunit
MNIFVCVKQVPDTESKMRPNADGSFVETTGLKWILSPYDEFAIEQALLIKGNDASINVTALRVGSLNDFEGLRSAMAMGADDAILVEAPDQLDSYRVAKALKGAIDKSGKKPDLIFTGKQSIDNDGLQVPQLLAQMLDIPSVSVIVGYEKKGDVHHVKREIEGGTIELYEVSGPALFTCNKGLNTPRYASLPGVLKAKKKPLAVYSLSDVGVGIDDKKVNFFNFRLPPEKPAGKKFTLTEDNKAQVVKDVVGLLRTEAKIL